jgi:hypothetical protein
VARILLVLGFCSLALAQAPVTPEGTDWRFAHPDSDMRLSVNLQALLNSPAIAKAIEQGKAQAKDNAMQVDLALGMLRTVDRISVSARQKAAPATKVSTNGVPDMDVLVQVTGSFDSQLIAGFFPSTGTSKVKVVGPHTILIGDGDSFARAAERMSVAAAPVAHDDLDQSDIWLSASSSFLERQAGGVSSQLPPGFQNMRGMSMGLNIGEAPEINVLLTAADAAGASEMLKIMQDAMGQVAPMAGPAAKALSMKQDGAKVRVHFVVPPEMVAMAQQQAASGGLPAQLAQLLGSFGLGGFGPGTPSKPPARVIAPEPPPQNGGKIVIYGLDGGPKQIPAPQ